MTNTADNLASELLESLKATNTAADDSSAIEWAMAIACCYDLQECDDFTITALQNAFNAYVESDSYMPEINEAAKLLDATIQGKD